MESNKFREHPEYVLKNIVKVLLNRQDVSFVLIHDSSWCIAGCYVEDHLASSPVTTPQPQLGSRFRISHAVCNLEAFVDDYFLVHVGMFVRGRDPGDFGSSVEDSSE